MDGVTVELRGDPLADAHILKIDDALVFDTKVENEHELRQLPPPPPDRLRLRGIPGCLNAHSTTICSSRPRT